MIHLWNSFSNFELVYFMKWSANILFNAYSRSDIVDYLGWGGGGGGDSVRSNEFSAQLRVTYMLSKNSRLSGIFPLKLGNSSQTSILEVFQSTEFPLN